ncbi:vegetative incompatibility protein HET-E-1-like [Dendronephthya gigantea]|uniref:vegetative incompatibility protein HET-E-1-like n=1 Tax=Dendronephthya gigantea TaxID=151771 RepID=UPI00106C64F8|nr:vegetative incompatibility protein HET-E-1-like [Dendronephthya gigantea]
MGQTDSRTFEGRVVQILSGHSRSVLHCEFTPDGTVLATCGADKTVLLWNVASGELIRSLQGHAAEVTSCCFYENILATSSKDKTVVLWLYESGRRASRLAIHSGPVLSCSISSSGQFLASCSEDKSIGLFKFQPGSGAFINGSDMKKLSGHLSIVNDIKFSPNGSFLASASQDKTIRIWETGTGTCAIVLDDPFGPVLKLRYSPSGDHMISLSSPGNFVSVWNTESNMVDNVLEANNGREIQNIAITSDGRSTIGLSKDNKITLWTKMTRKCTPELRTTQHKKGVNAMAITHSDCCVATADGEGLVLIWN